MDQLQEMYVHRLNQIRKDDVEVDEILIENSEHFERYQQLMQELQ